MPRFSTWYVFFNYLKKHLPHYQLASSSSWSQQHEIELQNTKTTVFVTNTKQICLTKFFKSNDNPCAFSYIHGKNETYIRDGYKTDMTSSGCFRYVHFIYEEGSLNLKLFKT